MSSARSRCAGRCRERVDDRAGRRRVQAVLQRHPGDYRRNRGSSAGMGAVTAIGHHIAAEPASVVPGQPLGNGQQPMEALARARISTHELGSSQPVRLFHDVRGRRSAINSQSRHSARNVAGWRCSFIRAQSRRSGPGSRRSAATVAGGVKTCAVPCVGGARRVRYPAHVHCVSWSPTTIAGAASSRTNAPSGRSAQDSW